MLAQALHRDGQIKNIGGNDMGMYSVEVDKSNPTALGHVLKELEKRIPDFEWEWKMVINAGSIDYGIYINIDTDRKDIEISNQPARGTEGADMLEDIFEEEEEDETEEV